MTEARNTDCIHFKVCKYSGCSQRHCDDYLTSHRSAKSDAVLDVKDEWRKYILSFKDEDPLFMAFSDGYDYCKKELRSQQKER